MRAKAKFPRICANDLIHHGYDVIFIQVNNQRGFLFGRKGTLTGIPNVFQLTLEERSKNPISRQLMDYQRGKLPQQYKTDIRTYYAKVLEMPATGAYIAWEII